MAIAQNPSFSFPDTGFQEVTLIVTHESGCQDTTTQIIDIAPKVAYFLPNAFTPNSDALNDLFFGKGFFLGMQNFNLTIWNRWGELVFEASDFKPNDPTVGWNGEFDNRPMNPGVFVWVAEVSFIDGYREVYKGSVTLIR